MSVFSRDELAYLEESPGLGRLATLDSTGAPHVVPVGWNYNPELDTIDIGGRDFAESAKFRRVRADPRVSFVIDDVLPPWRPRFLQVRGRAEALPEATWPSGEPRDAIIRIAPAKVVSFGLEQPS